MAACILWQAGIVRGEDGSTNATVPADPVLGLMLEKGMITEDEAAKVQAQVDARRTNMEAQYSEANSKWKISPGIKNMEFFGDLRLRYEDRNETDPSRGKIDLERYRYAVRFGVRGEAFDDFYYGFRMDTSPNPRSPWVTLGTSSSGTPYQGPFGKSTGGLYVGQLYLGWRPADWFELTVGKMPNPLYTSTMVWAPSINPEGLAEHLKYTVGNADFFVNMGQFLYQDENPVSASSGLFNGAAGQTANNIFQVAWQAGLTYHITTNISVKAGATIYQYYGMQRTSPSSAGVAPYYGDPFVGEGAYAGPGSVSTVNGASGYGTSGGLTGYASLGYPNNQVGLNNLTVLELPFEFNLKLKKVDVRLFGDVAYNFEGSTRAQAAASAYAAYLSSLNATIKPFSPQTDDNKAYQIGLAIGSKDALGMVNGSVAKKHAWEVRTYWQHVEQYALDPNLVDQDFFAGALNMEGIYAAVAYGFSDNIIGTFRYGHANRINTLLGTGGTGQDIQQINPINSFDLFQFDVSFLF